MMRLLVVGAVVTLTLSGCTGQVPPPPPDRADMPAVELPADRDEAAVISALRRIDLCAVLRTAATSAGVAGYEAMAFSPSACTLRLRGDDQDRVTVGVSGLDSGRRLASPAVVLGGARAYTTKDTTACEIWFPLTFRLALDLRLDAPLCDRANKLAAGVAGALADPAGVAARPRWEACEVLRRATDAEVRIGNLDTCTPLDDPNLRIDFTYPTDVPTFNAKRTRVNGVDVWLETADPSSGPFCSLSWAPVRGQFVVRVAATTCAKAEPLVGPVDALMRQPPPDGVPQEPLLYPPDEPDREFAGDCAFADVGNLPPRACAPHVGGAAPDGGDALRASDEPGGACALARDAVTQEFGDQFRPVVVTPRGYFACYFVTPERVLQVEFSVRPDAAVSRLSGRGAREIEVAGHSGHVTPYNDGYRYRVAASTNADEPGVLELSVVPGPVVGAEVPGDAGDKAQAVLGDIVRKHFG